MLDCVIDNLLANAIAISPANTTVAITVSRHEQSVQLTVCDEGPGLEDGESERLFDPFYRGNARDKAGTGLGLSITRTIVANHDGRITLTGRPGAGAIARVWLPANTNQASD